MTGCSLCGPHTNGQHPPRQPNRHPHATARTPRHRRRAAAPVFSQVATDSFAVVGFQDQITEYTATLHSVDFDGSQVTVDVELERDGNSAIIDQGGWLLFVNGQIVDNVERVFGTETLSAPAAAGDHVIAEWTTGQFGGHTATLDAGTLETDGGGGGNGGGNGGGDGGGDTGVSGRALLAVGGIAGVVLLASR